MNAGRSLRITPDFPWYPELNPDLYTSNIKILASDFCEEEINVQGMDSPTFVQRIACCSPSVGLITTHLVQ